MIDLSNLIDLFPSYFKENDTYKDAEGKGLLENFLNICGEYFKTSIEDLDNYNYNLDLEHMDDLYLNHLWEFLGSFPFLRSNFYDERTFYSIFKGDNLEEAKDLSRRSVKTLLDYTLKGEDKDKYIRRILPLVIGLYQIRGTDRFFEILFRLFGITNYVDISNYTGLTTTQRARVPSNHADKLDGTFNPKYISTFDNEDCFDKSSRFDREAKCNPFITRYYTIRNLPSTLDSTSKLEVISNIINLIREFVPYYIDPYFIVEDSSYNPSVTINVSNLTGTSVLSSGVVPPRNQVPSSQTRYFPAERVEYIALRVDVKYNNDPLDTLPKGYYMGEKDSSGKVVIDTTKVHYDEVVLIDKPGVYYFVPVINYNKTTPIEIAIESIIVTQKYFLTHRFFGSKSTLDTPLDKVTVNLNGGAIYESLHIAYNQVQIHSIQVPSNGTDEIYLESKPAAATSIPEIGKQIGKQIQINWPGTYVFYLKNNPSTKTTVTVGSSAAFDKILNTPTLYVENLETLYVRNLNYSPGTGTYSNWQDLKKEGVTGVYYKDGNVYSPHSYSIDFWVKTIFGQYSNININGATYRPVVDEVNNTVTYYRGNKPFALERNGRNATYIFSVPGYPELGYKSVAIAFESDVVQPSVKSYNDFAIIPNNTSYTGEGNSRYLANSNNQVQVTVETQVEFRSALQKNMLNRYSIFALVTTEREPTTGSSLQGTLGEDELFTYQGKAYGYLVELRYVRENLGKYLFRGSKTIPIKTLGNATDGAGLNYTLKAFPAVKLDSSTGISLSLVNPTGADEKKMSLYVRLMNIVDYLFFKIVPDTPYWTQSGRVSSQSGIGYTSAVFDYNAGTEPPTTEPTVQVWTMTKSDGEPTVPGITKIVDVSGNPVDVPLNEYADGKEDREDADIQSFSIPLFTSIKENSKVYEYYGAKVNNKGLLEVPKDANSTIRIEVRAPKHESWIDIEGTQYPIRETTAGRIVQIPKDQDKVVLSCQAYSNRVKPPYKLYFGNRVITTNIIGNFDLEVYASGQTGGNILFLDLLGDGVLDRSVEPSVRIDSASGMSAASEEESPSES